jgi:6-phosphogluconolactonase
MAPEVIVDAAGDLPTVLARRLEALAAGAFRERGRFALALPGGSVATAFLPVLARAAVDWPRADFYWGDERAVPPDHPDSNYGLARSVWLDDAGLPPAHVHRMPADAPALETAARQYEAMLIERLGSPPALDVALLGVGPDGHVCSLFPGHPLLGEERRFVAPILDSPKAPPRRLTLTLPALAAARLVVVAAFGEGKAAVLGEALRNPGSRLPVALVLQRAARSLVLLDPAAAGRS